jgi:putative transposase
MLGAKLIHASPRAATTKGKIERFFRTVRDQFLVELEHRDDLDLGELNRLFGAWLEVVYHRRVHTETGQTPLARFAAAGAPALPTPAILREAFLWSEKRTVTKTATVSLHGNDYEVDPALAGRRCELVYDPFDLARVEVRFRDKPFGDAVAVRIGRHTHPRAERQLEPPPTPTGIDYLGLLAARRDEELAGPRIDYAQLSDPDDRDDRDDRDDEDRPGHNDARGNQR